jgi:hypothetical protein
LNDRVGKLLSAFLFYPETKRKKEKTYGKKLGGIVMEMIPLFFGHDPSIQFPDLIILANLSLMGPMRSPRNDVGSSLVRSFSY